MFFRKSSRLIISAILLTFLALLFIKAKTVQATFSDMYVIHIIYKVESEILQKTPAGQYYDSLFWNHSQELGQLVAGNSGKYEELMSVNRLFIPGLVALLEGNGDTVQITYEQVESLQTQLDWLASVGSPALREDIQKERQRFPSDAFIGMTMNEAWDFINSKWTTDVGLQPNSVPNQVVNPALMIGSPTQPTPATDTWTYLHVAPVKPALVPGSEGTWSYLMFNGTYLEYPTRYFVLPLTSTPIIFMPSEDWPAQLETISIMVDMYDVPFATNEEFNLEDIVPEENIVWESRIQTTDFEGTEYLTRMPNETTLHLYAILYSKSNHLVVNIYVHNISSLPENSDYLKLLNERYPYFQYMIHSVRIQTP